ncbi:Poly(rC)-binding protein 3 [Triticum urartu]|uniref:Poly(RC)-binding protein 3 n=1 Tax=Triticum urartu TaxID=4572 RepID=M7ZZ72_TRIUA|nr:Poly(rC)-binding protein 3 [Triticum urartu]
MWERRTHARILVRDADAGRIIGSAGSSIAAMEKEAGSGARITLSGRDQILAGTDRRVVFLSGPFRAVMDAADLLLQKIPPRYQGEQADNTVVLVVPYACCGALIGKGGTLIKWLAQESNAGITVSHHRLCYGFNDRLVNITGRLEHQLQAIFLILSELLDDVHYLSSYQNQWLAAALVFHVVMFQVLGVTAMLKMSMSRDTTAGDLANPVNQLNHLLLLGFLQPDTPVGSADVDDGRDVQGTLTIAVASEYVGAVIGRGGRVIKEIQQATGALITVFKGKLLPGMRERWVGTNDIQQVSGGGDQRDAGGGGCRGGDDRGAHLVRHGSPRTEAGWRGEEAFPFVKPVE